MFSTRGDFYYPWNQNGVSKQLFILQMFILAATRHLLKHASASQLAIRGYFASHLLLRTSHVGNVLSSIAKTNTATDHGTRSCYSRTIISQLFCRNEKNRWIAETHRRTYTQSSLFSRNILKGAICPIFYSGMYMKWFRTTLERKLRGICSCARFIRRSRLYVYRVWVLIMRRAVFFLRACYFCYFACSR